MDLYGSKRNYKKNGNKRKNAITSINIAIMILTAILVIPVGIYLCLRIVLRGIVTYTPS